MRTRIHLSAPFLAVALLSPGTAAQQPGDDARLVVRLEARPSSLSLAVGETVPLEIIAYDAAGGVVDAPVRLAGPRSQVRVDHGEVEGLVAGEYQLIATVVLPAGARGEPATLRIPTVVSWPMVARVELWPLDSSALYVGTTVRYGARALHADDSERPDAAILITSRDPQIASIDATGHVTGIAPGTARLVATLQATRGLVEATTEVAVAAFPAVELRLEGGATDARTGDVLEFSAVAVSGVGDPIEDMAVEWSHVFTPNEGMLGTPAGGQVMDGRFVADLPGVHTVVASAGPLSSRARIRVSEREAVRALDVVGVGRQSTMRTTDFWVFEGVDGRDYALTGSKVADGHAFMFDVSDPSNIVKTDSVQVDARAVNDVKVSPDGRYATLTREGASNRRNGVVILDLADPAHPTVSAEVSDRLTGGVHNAFPTDSHVFALSAGDKYVIIDVADIYQPHIVGEYDHPDSRVHDVWVHDGIAYSAEWENGIVAVDVGNGRWGGSPENPVLINTYPIPEGRTHAVFPYVQQSTGRFYLFSGDEIMSRRGLAWAGYPGSMGSYAAQYDPETGLGGIPLTTRGYIQVVDFTDPDSPRMVARYEMPEYGTHNIWVEDDILYQAYYEGGVRMVDVSGELMGNLYTQGREIAVFKSADPAGYVPNATMVWSAMPFKGHVFFSDTNSGLWAVKLESNTRPVS